VAAEKPRPLPQAINEQPAKPESYSFNACNWRALRAGAAPTGAVSGTPSVLIPRGDFDRAQQASAQGAPQDCTPPSTMVMSDFKLGQGKLVESRRAVMVHYTGWLYDPRKPDGKGEQFDSSRNQPLGFSFMVGVGRMIKGWDEGVLGMKEGGRRLLIIPPNMAYGDRAGGPIPPGSTLIFDVEVLRVLQ
jgi:FKBP-type peptidyl-prolyl cis-trans isomerase FkpA